MGMSNNSVKVLNLYKKIKFTFIKKNFNFEGLNTEKMHNSFTKGYRKIDILIKDYYSHLEFNRNTNYINNVYKSSSHGANLKFYINPFEVTINNYGFIKIDKDFLVLHQSSIENCVNNFTLAINYFINLKIYENYFLKSLNSYDLENTCNEVLLNNHDNFKIFNESIIKNEIIYHISFLKSYQIMNKMILNKRSRIELSSQIYNENEQCNSSHIYKFLFPNSYTVFNDKIYKPYK